MPGFFITNAPSVPELKNYDPTRCISGEMKYGELTIRWNVLDKFLNDKLFYQDDTCIVVLDGIIFNKKELISKTASETWAETVKKCFAL